MPPAPIPPQCTPIRVSISTEAGSNSSVELSPAEPLSTSRFASPQLHRTQNHKHCQQSRITILFFIISPFRPSGLRVHYDTGTTLCPISILKCGHIKTDMSIRPVKIPHQFQQLSNRYSRRFHPVIAGPQGHLLRHIHNSQNLHRNILLLRFQREQRNILHPFHLAFNQVIYLPALTPHRVKIRPDDKFVPSTPD